jgi:hypothetical protein
MRVNGEPAEPGCYAEGHRGQYAIDHLADICEQFGIAFDDDDDPRFWRRAADAETAQESAVVRNAVGIGSHLASPEECWERHVWAGDRLEELLNAHAEGGYWEWVDGEFFLTQTEVEGIAYLPVDDDDDYDDAWRWLVENGPLGLLGSYDDLDRNQKAYRFRITVHYEPDEQPEEWSAHEIALGLDN